MILSLYSSPPPFRLQTVNPAMSTIFGFTKEEFLEMNVSQLCPSPHAELHDEYLEKYLRTGESDVIGT